MNNFVFTQENKENVWGAFKVALKAWHTSHKKFEVVIREYRQERGEQALKAYWVLIGIVQQYMNKNCGNTFTKEEISDYFKMQAGHKRRVNEIDIPRSIANNAGCKWDDMKNILDYILRFGVEHEIRGCEITTMQKQEYYKYYGVEW